MSKLFPALRLRGVEFRNRVFVSPTCQYSSEGGMPNDWHLVHLGSRAAGGAGDGDGGGDRRLAGGPHFPGDTGLWSDAHAAAFGLSPL
jgi:2,4-dienoyl-CoA reductase-like NADH-dependent reductase (Old Yellow Enzyme family)